jgi:hypothetical protein
MSSRIKLAILLAVTVVASACSSPTAPKQDECFDPATVTWGRC